MTASSGFFGESNQRMNVLRDIGRTIEQVDCKYIQIAFVVKLSTYKSIDYLKITVESKNTKKV